MCFVLSDDNGAHPMSTFIHLLNNCPRSALKKTMTNILSFKDIAKIPGVHIIMDTLKEETIPVTFKYKNISILTHILMVYFVLIQRIMF